MSDRYEKLNKLDSEQEILTILMEECAEVTQAASKCIRFESGIVNLTRLEKEIGDLLGIIDIMYQYGLANENSMQNHIESKKNKLKFYSNLNFE